MGRPRVHAAAKDFAQIRNYQGWVVADLGSGVAADGVARAPEVQLALVVVLERNRAAVVVEEVGFDRDLLFGPKEVDLPLADLDVDRGAGQGVARAEAQEVELEVGASSLGL